MTNNEITYEVRGAIYDVYKELGPGLLESVYEEALCFELEQRGLKVERQLQVPIRYKDKVLKTELQHGQYTNSNHSRSELKPAQKAQIPLTEIYYEYLFQMMSWFSLEVS